MKITYTGHRYLHDYDLDTINARMQHDVRDAEVEEMFFGGAIGTDSVALRFAYLARGASGTRPILTVVCPDVRAALPTYPRASAARYADRYIELHHPLTAQNSWHAYQLRNEWMVDQVHDCGQVVAFWHGRRQGGTWNTIDYVQRTLTPWEHIPILGAEAPLPR